MSILIILIHLVACIALIAIVLLQTGKGAEMGAAFGGASQTLFGGTGGSSFMSKLTTGMAVVFMITCLMLAYMYRPGSTGGRSVMTDIPTEQTKPPATEVPPAVPEARPVQPEGTIPTPEASQKTETPQHAPADITQQQVKPESETKPPAAKAQSQQGKQEKKTPAKKQ